MYERVVPELRTQMPKPVIGDYGVPDHPVVLVTGPRKIDGAIDVFEPIIRAVFLAERDIGGKFTLVHGDAQGIDKLCDRIARDFGFQVIAVPYFGWLRGGGGPARNAFMIDEYRPRSIHAFHFIPYDQLPQPGSGTADCVSQALARHRLVVFHTPSSVDMLRNGQIKLV